MGPGLTLTQPSWLEVATVCAHTPGRLELLRFCNPQTPVLCFVAEGILLSDTEDRQSKHWEAWTGASPSSRRQWDPVRDPRTMRKSHPASCSSLCVGVRNLLLGVLPVSLPLICVGPQRGRRRKLFRRRGNGELRRWECLSSRSPGLHDRIKISPAICNTGSF